MKQTSTRVLRGKASSKWTNNAPPTNSKTGKIKVNVSIPGRYVFGAIAVIVAMILVAIKL